jgi:hypothetical protein
MRGLALGRSIELVYKRCFAIWKLARLDGINARMELVIKIQSKYRFQSSNMVPEFPYMLRSNMFLLGIRACLLLELGKLIDCDESDNDKNYYLPMH